MNRIRVHLSGGERLATFPLWCHLCAFVFMLIDGDLVKTILGIINGINIGDSVIIFGLFC